VDRPNACVTTHFQAHNEHDELPLYDQAMPFPPANPKLYHIVHVNNLASIVADGFLWSDAEMRNRNNCAVIGMQTIKQRRLTLPVACHRPTCVGDYVPFYFCSRSIMLYVIYRGNNPELLYHGGQGSYRAP
jgi:hypothetical protein